MAARRARPRIAILGCGAVGQAFARELTGKRGPVRFRGELTVWSRSRRSVRRCLAGVREWSGEAAQRVRVARSPEDAVQHADIALLCLSEPALHPVVRATSRALAGRKRQPVLLVTSGSQGLAPLRAELGPGVALGRFHPLTPVFAGALGLQHLYFGIEGDARARRAAQALLPHWDGKALDLRPGRAARYHAGAALLGGGLVALFALAEKCMAPSVRSRRDLRAALLQFALVNAHHAGSFGPVRALTGPLARGSEPVVREHLRVLRADPGAGAAYRVLGQEMLALARSRGSIDASTERRLRRLLRSRARGR